MVKPKKAWVRTLEALIAIFITLLFVAFILPERNTATSGRAPNVKILDTLKENENFRNCIIVQNTTCINDTIRNSLEARFDFAFNITTDPSIRPPLQNQPSVFAEGIIISGNSTYYNPRIFRVYYWPKPQ